MNFNFNVRGDKLRRVNTNEGYSGNANYRCNFLFSSEWEGLESFAVFTKGEAAYTLPLEEKGCIIPQEVVETAGEFYIGLFGTEGAGEDTFKRISTNLVCIEIEEGAFREGEVPAEPTPSIWETYEATIRSAVEEAKSARDEATQAVNDAENAKDAAEVAQGKAEAAQAAAEVAEENSAANAKESAEKLEGVTRKLEEAEEYANSAAENRELAEAYKADAEAARNEAVVSKGDAEAAKSAAEAAALRAEESAQKVDGTEYVHTFGDEEINGKKTFNDGITAYSVDGGDMGLEFKTSSGVDFRSETYFNIDAGGANIDIKTKSKVYINYKEVAVKDDITTAIQSAVLDSWAEVTEP